MAADRGPAELRLALLLAGGGGRCRRLVAEAVADTDLLSALAKGGCPKPLLRTAGELLSSEVPGVLRRVEEAGWRWVVPADREFPELLRPLADPPLGLFVRGRLHSAPTVAVVGSRRASAYGRQVARLLGEELARAGVIVVSGMARGVDAAAHEGALGAAGHTWAVWGTGPDRIYPPEHGALAAAIADDGALITEYPPGTPPRKHHFPERNRLLAGAAMAVVVVEAAARSGALVTARLALDEGREVFAVPGNIFSELSIGPNALLRLGARPLLTPRELLESVGVDPAAAAAGAAPDSELLEHIAAGEAVSADEIAGRCSRPVHELLPELLELELAGSIERQADGRYARRRGSQ
jgi:DNA processing protein